MATFGSGVNAALGAINYSPYTQGAIAGGQGIGQGIAALGQGIQQYQQNKVLTASQIGKFEAAVQANPGIIQEAPESVKKLINKLQKNGSLALKDAAQLGAYTDVYSQKETERIARQAAQLQNMMQQTGGRIPSMVNQQAFDPRATTQATRAFLENDVLAAQAGNYREQAQQRVPAGAIMTIEQINGLKGQGFDVKAVPIPGAQGQFRVESMSPFAPPAQTNINMNKTPENEFYSGLNQGLVKEITDFQSNVLPSTQQSIDNVNRSLAMLDVGAKVGPGQNIKLTAANALNAVIPGLIDTSKEENLKMSLADMSLDAAQKIAGQGQVTDSERKRIDTTIPTFGNTEKAVRYALSYVDAVNKRNLAKGEMVNELTNRKATPDEIRAAWTSFNGKNPLVFGEDGVSFGAPSNKMVGRFEVQFNP